MTEETKAFTKIYKEIGELKKKIEEVEILVMKHEEQFYLYYGMELNSKQQEDRSKELSEMAQNTFRIYDSMQDILQKMIIVAEKSPYGITDKILDTTTASLFSDLEFARNKALTENQTEFMAKHVIYAYKNFVWDVIKLHRNLDPGINLQTFRNISDKLNSLNPDKSQDKHTKICDRDSR